VTDKERVKTDVLYFVENILHVQLFEPQKRLLEAIARGDMVIMARPAGKTYLRNIYKQYEKYLEEIS
jgi:hypothetical protein